MQENKRENSNEIIEEDETLRRHPKKKISSYLPVGLLKDLSFDEDSICEETEMQPSERRRSSGKQGNYRRRRSSSQEFLKSSLNLLNSFAYNMNLHVNQETINDKSNFAQYDMTKNPPMAQTFKSILKYNFTSPNDIIPAMKPMEKKVIFNAANNNYIYTFPSQGAKYQNKNSQREFIDPDLLNPNQTFREFLDNVGNKLCAVIRTSIGSRYLQKMLEKINEEDIYEIFSRLGDSITDLICDNYGNYFMQKIILKCNLKQRLFLFNKLDTNFLDVTLDIAGTHCIQSLIEAMNTEEEELIFKQKIENYLLDLSCNMNSTHVIQKLVTELKESKREYINNFIFLNFLTLCKDVNGICLIKKFISENVNEQIMKHILLLLEKNFFEITQDQFGNYAIQHALDKYGYAKCYKIISLICSSIIYFANQKFSSNVIDKIMIILGLNNRNEFSQLLQTLFLCECNLLELVRNKYGMYVLLNIIKLLSKEEKFIIHNFIMERSKFYSLEDKTFLSKLIKQIQEPII